MLLRCNKKPWNKRNKAMGICDFPHYHIALLLVEPKPSCNPLF